MGWGWDDGGWVHSCWDEGGGVNMNTVFGLMDGWMEAFF